MNSKLIKLLAVVCISLCLVIAGEWLYASYMRHRLLTSITSATPQDYKADELPEIELTKQPEENYADLVARPLFIKGRRAVDEPSSDAAQGASKSEGFDWQLTGVYSTKKTVSALFSRSKSRVAKDNHRKITLGDDIDGWKLIEINKDRAVFKQGSNEKELLLRKPKLKVLPHGTNGATPVTPAPAPVPAAIPEPPSDTTGDTSEGKR
ncbi:MAG: hypothetical protein Q8L79_06250 [Methylobacter sp.]|uniref:hypothetical protein n=1 Tax=Methylobacter sp. TaxID=2051955 RepID=UPI00272F2A58|nr:hypothetical protein [Methylobacter sp.]MDP1664714.1 hypothetical protein [Methylobacter sp.]